MLNSLLNWKRNIAIFCIVAMSVFSANAEDKQAEDKGRGQNIEVVFVLDTTGSMASLIDGAKRKIWSIANTIIDVNPDAKIRMALVAYRDQGDEYVTQTYDLSSDVQGLYGKLIKLEADGGGDAEESVNEALDEAVRKLNWTKTDDTKRIVFLVGDAPPHMDYPNAPLYPDVLKRAKADGIIVNTVQAGDDPDTRRVWKEIAQLGHGQYLAIPQDGGKIVVIETPYDNDIILIQKKIDKTVLPYGNREKKTEVLMKMETKAKADTSVQVDNSRFYSKKTGVKEVVTGGGDLVTDINKGKQTLEALKEEELPEKLRGNQSNEKKQEILKQISEERSQLEQEMVDLVSKRDAYIAEQSKKPSKDVDSFDTVVEKTLREQLK